MVVGWTTFPARVIDPFSEANKTAVMILVPVRVISVRRQEVNFFGTIGTITVKGVGSVALSAVVGTVVTVILGREALSAFVLSVVPAALACAVERVACAVAGQGVVVFPNRFRRDALAVANPAHVHVGRAGADAEAVWKGAVAVARARSASRSAAHAAFVVVESSAGCGGRFNVLGRVKHVPSAKGRRRKRGKASRHLRVKRGARACTAHAPT